MELELRAAESTLAKPPQACGVPGAAELAKLLNGQLRGDILVSQLLTGQQAAWAGSQWASHVVHCCARLG